MSVSWEGLLLIDKPSGPTSHDVVALVRRATRQRRIGHAGTLDPSASGLLPLVLGRATRLVRFMPHSPKAYEGTFRLGLSTDSDDLTGTVLSEHTGPLPEPTTVRDAARRFLGKSEQVPPAISARKVGGERLYRLARRGKPATAPATTIEVTRFDVVPLDEPGIFRFVAEVTGGTYIRGLVRDLGAGLGCGGALGELRRTAIGPMQVDQALTLRAGEPPDPETLARALVPPADMPLEPPPLSLPDSAAAACFSRGGTLPAAELGPTGPGLRRVLGPDGRLLGLGETLEGRFRPRVVLVPVEPPDRR